MLIRCRRLVRWAQPRHLNMIHVRVYRKFCSLTDEPPPLAADATGEGEQRWVLQPPKLSSDPIGKDEKWAPKEFSDQDIYEINQRLREEKKSNKRTRGGSNQTAPLVPLASVRGFLELNPHVCSGCGTQFQSKSPDSPGYLAKDKLVEHKIKAERIKQQQDALKLLDLVSINAESELAYNVLKEGNVPDDIIHDVIALARQMYKHIPKDIFGLGDAVPSSSAASAVGPHDTPPSSAERCDTSNVAATDKTHPSAADTEPLGYHPDTLEPIYDVEELRLSFLSDEFDPKEKYKKFQWNKHGGIGRNPSDNSDPDGITTGDGVVDSTGSAIPICQRCFRLQMYGECDNALRPGWSSHELLTPSRFQELLKGIKESKCVVLCLVDLFDIEGSIVPNLKEIAGKNPIVIVANKVDLLPKDASLNRVNDWVHSLVRKKCDLLSPRETDELDSKLYAEKGWYPSRKNSEAGILRRGNVHLVSCDKGTGLPELLTSVVGMAKDNGDKVYVMGTANVGKSSFINRLLRYSKKQKGTTMQSRKKLAVPQATVSSLPGTTLDFLKIKLPNGLTVIDTPGLINPGQITTKLNSTELKKVIPSKRVSHVTLRIDEGRCVLIGALAKFELVQGRPVQCTFFISNEVKLHPTSSERADEILTQHDGQLVFPPASKQRLTELGPWEYTMLNVTGQGWKKATCDIAIGGLGFVSVTGPGMFQIKVSVPKGTSVTVRDPMLPFEASKTSVRHTGTRFIRKGGGIGWRV